MLQVNNIFIKVMIKQDEGIEDSPKIIKKDDRKYIKTPHRQMQSPAGLYDVLHTANPILPPDVHTDIHQNHSLKYKYLVQKSKLNKTTFPQVRARNWLNQTQGYLGGTNKLQRNKMQLDSFVSLQQQENEQQDYCQFKQFVVNKIHLYTRVNNKTHNKITRGQMGFYCSFFMNCRKQEIKSRKIPVFEYLPRIYKQLKPQQSIPDILTFNSNFQSGNLFCVFKNLSQNFPTYELLMQNDINTKGCTQWFYFSINAQRRVKFKLKIMNFYKPTSLYMNGMKILVSNDLTQWKRIGTSIKYYKIQLQSTKDSYCLEFIYEIEQPDKPYYFCYGYPYTYSRLEQVLARLADIQLYSRIALRSVLCQSFLGNNVPILTISNHLKGKIKKPLIYIIARQHPGQTPGSFIVQGLTKTLLSNRLQAEELREKYIIKIVPMINVDGVINGNYRANISGNDVNRQWQQPSKKIHPQIYYLKQEIVSNKKNVQLFLDIHAHSRKMNSFFYGSKSISMENRLYPFVCSKLNKNIKFYQSSFMDDPSKKTTARVILENEASIKKSVTFEASFYGSEDYEKKIKVHFKEDDFRAMGQSLALGLYYSEIGIAKLSPNNQQTQQVGLQKSKKQQESTRNSVSCQLAQQTKKSKKSQIIVKIEKNCIRIMQKWKKQLERMRQDEVASEGSELDPQHFQLTQLEEEKIGSFDQINSKLRSQEVLVFEVNQQQKDKNFILPSKDEMKLEKRLYAESYQSNEKQQNGSTLNPNKDQKKSEGQQNNTSTKLSFFPIQSNLRNTMIVKKLENQLQLQKSHRRYQSYRSARVQGKQQEENKVTNQFGNQIIRGQRFKSIDIQPTKESNNYRNNIIQMKKALKYFIENKSYDYKSSDYDDYKAYLKYSTNGNTLVFTDKESIARIKKKYSRI